MCCGGVSNRKTTTATGKQLVWFKDETLTAKNSVMTKGGKTEKMIFSVKESNPYPDSWH